MKGQNILITSAGKRVTLVRLFQQALQAYIPGGKVYTTDMNPELAPAGYVSDGCLKVPPVTDKYYISTLLDICKKKGIGIVIPTIDTELPILAKSRHLFILQDTEVVISDLPFISCTMDKRLTSTFFAEHDIRIPRPINPECPSFPMFAKPYDGSLSKGIHVIRSKNELTEEILSNPKLLFMEYIDRKEYKEFTVDMYYGKDSCVKSIVPRERLEIRAGEINKGITRKNILIPFLKERLGYLPGVRGCICVQLFYKEEIKDVIGIEVNARFGGGYPLTYYAGANYPSWIIREYLADESRVYEENWENNTLMLRYDAEVIHYAHEQEKD